MKRINLMLFILFAFGLQGRAMGQGEESASYTQNVSPPPIRTSHIQEGAMSSNNAAMYVGMDSGGIDLKMYGLSSEATWGITDKVAISVVGAGLYGGSTGSMDTGMGSSSQIDMSVGMGTVGANLLFSLVQSEKRNSIGEITKIGSGLSFFGGGQFSLMGMSFEIPVPENFSGMHGAHGTGRIYQFHIGAIGELALHSQIQLVPYAYVGTTAGSINMTMYLGLETLEQTQDIPSSTLTSYGADIVIRPSRTNPKLKISLGTLLQQIEANEGGMLFILIGLNYEIGTNYSEASFGPVLQ